MRKFQWIGLAVLAVTFVQSTAMAVVIPGWERPVQTAALEHVDGVQPVLPHVVSVTMNQRDGEEYATSFTLVEDTGIRCVMAPCPSSTSTLFRVTDRKEQRNGTVSYVAYEVVKPLPHVRGLGLRLAPRVMRLTDYSNSLNVYVNFLWDVRLRSLRGTTVYGGNPSPVYTIQ